MTDQQNAALLPCPFCGGEAEQGQNADTCGEAVHCITCGAEGKQFHPTEYGYTFGDDAQAYAVAYEAAVSAAILAWNTRPAPAEDGLREFVESIVNAMGPYPDLNGHPIISAAYAALRSKPEASTEKGE